MCVCVSKGKEVTFGAAWKHKGAGLCTTPPTPITSTPSPSSVRMHGFIYALWWREPREQNEMLRQRQGDEGHKVNAKH